MPEKFTCGQSNQGVAKTLFGNLVYYHLTADRRLLVLKQKREYPYISGFNVTYVTVCSTIKRLFTLQ